MGDCNEKFSTGVQHTRSVKPMIEIFLTGKTHNTINGVACGQIISDEQIKPEKLIELEQVKLKRAKPITCNIKYSSLTHKTKLSFNVLPKIVIQWHTNKPWSSLPKDCSFTPYCMSKYVSTKLVGVYVHLYACHSPLSYLWNVLVCAHALIP